MGKNRVCYFYDGASPAPCRQCSRCVPCTRPQPAPECLRRSAARHHYELRASKRARCADEVAGLYYGLRHPMKPQRITMTHHLVLGYRLHDFMDVYVRPLAFPCAGRV